MTFKNTLSIAAIIAAAAFAVPSMAQSVTVDAGAVGAQVGAGVQAGGQNAAGAQAGGQAAAGAGAMTNSMATDDNMKQFCTASGETRPGQSYSTMEMATAEQIEASTSIMVVETPNCNVAAADVNANIVTGAKIDAALEAQGAKDGQVIAVTPEADGVIKVYVDTKTK